jgi:hypothetical protein
MARRKYATKRGTESPPATVSGGAGSRIVGTSGSLPAVPPSSTAGGLAEPPQLGIAVMSSWGWRILAVFTLVALGLTITFALDGHTAFAVIWLVITGAWGFFSLVLWRRHLAWDMSYVPPPRNK